MHPEAPKSKREPSPRTRKRLHCLDSVRGLNVMLPGPRTDHTCSDFGTRTIAFFLDAEPQIRTIMICDVKRKNIVMIGSSLILLAGVCNVLPRLGVAWSIGPPAATATCPR